MAPEHFRGITVRRPFCEPVDLADVLERDEPVVILNRDTLEQLSLRIGELNEIVAQNALVALPDEEDDDGPDT